MALDWNNKNICQDIMLPGGTKVTTFEPPKILGMKADMITLDDTAEYEFRKEFFNGLINYIRNADKYNNIVINTEDQLYDLVTHIRITVTIPTSAFNGIMK